MPIDLGSEASIRLRDDYVYLLKLRFKEIA